MSRTRNVDPSGLNRGPLTRRLPVLWQAAPSPPALGPFEVPAEIAPWRFLLRVLFSARRLTIPAAALSVLHQVGEALVPVIAGVAIDRALSTGDPAQLFLWLGVLGLNFLMLSLAYRFSAQLTARATETAQHRLRATLSARVLHPEGSSRHRPDGAVVSTMTNDVARIGMLGLAVFPVGELAGVLFIAVSLLLIHWPLGIAVLVGAPVVVWLMGVFSGQYARASRGYQSLLAQTVGRATDLVSGYRVIKGVRAEAEATRRYRDASRQTRDGAYRSIGALGRFLTGSDALSGAFMAGVAGLAAWFAIAGELSVGGLIAAVGLAQALLPPMRMLTGNAVPLWAAAVASGDRVLDALTQDAGFRAGSRADPPDSKRSDRGAVDRADRTTAPDASPGHRTVPAESSGEVPVVALSIPGHGDVRVAPGELLGIRADDTTASRLAQAILHPRIGDEEIGVFLDDVPAHRVANDVYRSCVVAAPHRTTLFTGSIAANLTLAARATVQADDRATGVDALAGTVAGGDLDTADQRHTEALQAAACEDFVAVAGGAEAPVGEMGGRLSGGQRQRLALARALASRAPVLVLHDPTTAVDSVTEARIASHLPGVRRGRSTILVASSPALLGMCDRIVDLRPSIEAGTR